MNKVLFISPTTYSDPVTKDIQIKFKSLSKVCNPIVFAFSDKKSTTVIEGVETIFNKKNKNISQIGDLATQFVADFPFDQSM